MDQIIETLESYIIYIEDNGYYAEKQNSSRWNFTDDYQYAKRYKSKKSAYHNLIKHIGEYIEYKDKEVFIQPLIINQITDFNIKEMTHIDIKYEPKNIVTFTKDLFNVKIESVSIEDEFWG